jgi:hypothetical protein
MSRFDKYDGNGGGFRAPLAAAIIASQVGVIQGVWINGSGRAAIGGAAAASGIKGVICPVRPMNVGEPIDCMVDGEIVDLTDSTGAAIAAGTDVFAAFATGAITVTSTGSPQYIGHTVEASRLVVHVAR